MSTLPPDAGGEQPPVQPEQAPAASVPPPASGQPQYTAPPAQGGYQAPPAGAYQQPAQNPASNLQLNYWLSVFFSWLPALIFFVINKDKGDSRVRELDAANLNFSLVRIFAVIAAWIISLFLMFIPYLGFLGGFLVFVAWAGGLVLHILAAAKAEEAYRTGQPVDPFLFNLKMVS